MSVLKKIAWFFWSRIVSFVSLLLVAIILVFLSVAAFFHPAPVFNLLNKIERVLGEWLQ